jgi:transglutaminase superfamily protein
MARRLGSFWRLSFSDKRLLMRAALAVVSAKLAIRTLRLPAAQAAVTRSQRFGWFVMPASVERVIWAVEAAGRAIPGMKNCLVAAVAAEAMLARTGHPCELRIGVAKNAPNELIAHAWLESEGRVLIGEFELDRYKPLTAPHLRGSTTSVQR